MALRSFSLVDGASPTGEVWSIYVCDTDAERPAVAPPGSICVVINSTQGKPRVWLATSTGGWV